MQQDGRNSVGSLEDIRITRNDQGAAAWVLHEPQFGGEDDNAGRLRTNECAGDMEAVLGQQVVEVVAGDAARDLWEVLAYQRAVLITQSAQTGIDFTATATSGDDGLEFVFRGRSNGKDSAVVEQNLQLQRVVVRLAAVERVRSAGIIAQHAAERAVRVGCRVGREEKAVLPDLCL